MKIRPVLFFAACAVLLATHWTLPASAQEPTGSKDYPLSVKVVDIEAISRTAVAAKDIRAQLQKFRAQFQADIQKEEEELRKANQELARKRTLLAPEVFADERRKFEQRVVELQRMAQARNSEFSRISADAGRELRNAVNKALGQVAKENKITLILDRKAVAMFHDPLDITAVVLKRLNEQFPSYTVKIPEPGK
jgi:outer membrane protein